MHVVIALNLDCSSLQSRGAWLNIESELSHEGRALSSRVFVAALQAGMELDEPFPPGSVSRLSNDLLVNLHRPMLVGCPWCTWNLSTSETLGLRPGDGESAKPEDSHCALARVSVHVGKLSWRPSPRLLLSSRMRSAQVLPPLRHAP